MIQLSLKWQIQLWHALILASVLGALGFGFYFYEKGHRVALIDEQLNSSIHPLKGPLISFANTNESFHGGHPPRRKRPKPQISDEAHHPSTLSSETPAKITGGWQRLASQKNVPPIHPPQSPDSNAHAAPHKKFEHDLVPKGYYGRASRSDGKKASYQSPNFPEIKMPDSVGNGSFTRWRDGKFREVYHEQNQFQIIVGYDMSHMSASLNLLKIQLLASLFAVFLFALLVGQFLVSRAIKPLSKIETSASKIAQGELSERVPAIAASGATELKSLTSNLNETFAQLEGSFQRQIRFTADASHELRTPLTALLAQIEHGLKRERSSEEHTNILEVCKRSSTRIRRITEQLIELSRYDSGRVEMDLEEVSLTTMFTSLTEELTPYVCEQGHTLQADIKNCREITCDPFRLEQVITNLINNAVQHNNSPVSITLRAATIQNSCVIEVVDTGKGIQPENIDKLFSRFFQESASRSKNPDRPNVGLGLSISKAIIKAHSGTLTATSEPNVKTTFRITLPISRGDSL